jgi:uncharacterized protein YraI
MALSSRRPDPARRLTAEGHIHWLRGLLIVAAMAGVFIVFFVVLSLLQSVGHETAQIRGVAAIPTGQATTQPAAAQATARPAANAAPAAATPSSASATPLASPTGVTAVARGNPYVRSGPGIDSPILTNLQVGETVAVIGRTPDTSWLQIMLPNGVRGWSSASLLGVSGNIGNVPETQ